MKTLTDLQNLSPKNKLLILGYGRENRQFLDWLLKILKVSNESIVIADKNPVQLDSDHLNIQSITGDSYLQALQGDDLSIVVKAPGIWSLLPELQEFRKFKGQDSVVSSYSFFIQQFYDQVIGITGTKGKSTTSNLVTHLINGLGGYKAIYCGNTSNISPYQFWTELDKTIDPKVYYVMELSSFQLQDLGFSQLSPKHSIIVNYYLDHQDQHARPEEYWGSKDQIFKYQRPRCNLVYNTQILDRVQTQIPIWGVGLDFEKSDMSGVKKYLALPGRHNRFNALLALNLVARVFDLELAQVYPLLKGFEGLEHRMQKFLEADLSGLSLSFYDDGYGTDTQAVKAAVETLTEDDKSLTWLWICGVDKGSSMADLQSVLKDKFSLGKFLAVEFCGEVGKRLFDELGLPSPNLILNSSFRDRASEVFGNQEKLAEILDGYLKAVDQKSDQITKINIILSPGGSSFDEFKNATQRAGWWTDKVSGLFG
jgi:UDP-N-acetylmuramoylalanine-D-glutamate ligase